MAILNGYLFIFPDYDGGVGGLLDWKSILGIRQTPAIIASAIIK